MVIPQKSPVIGISVYNSLDLWTILFFLLEYHVTLMHAISMYFYKPCQLCITKTKLKVFLEMKFRFTHILDRYFLNICQCRIKTCILNVYALTDILNL